MKVLLLGSGGREHALGWRLARSSRVDSLVSCPGNGGLSLLGPCWSDLDPLADSDSFFSRLQSEKVDLVVIGPEAPLVSGLADELRSRGIPTFGPGAAASRLEGSKAFAKRFMTKHGVPTARFRIVEDAAELRAAIADLDGAVVVKADGLAGGKGVTITSDSDEAEEVAARMLAGTSFGDAGRIVVLEEKLAGLEMTMLVLVSGKEYRLLEPAQDYKPLGEGNTGPNTGGMGSYSPSHLLTRGLTQRIVDEILEPTLRGLDAEGTVFRGVLYLGLMLTAAGPRLLEYNVRFGDPETQPLMMRLRTDPIEILEAVDSGRLGDLELAWDPRPALCVVMAAEGYPGRADTGLTIEGPVTSELDEDVQVFHAGTTRSDSGFSTTGGRVVGVTALGDDLKSARTRAYARIERIHFPGCYYRKDIGLHAEEG